MRELSDKFKLAGEKYVDTNYRILENVIKTLISITETDYKKISV